MSHELRTPLNAIIGFSEIMESGLFGPLGDTKYLEYCRDIRESGRYLLDVINDILDMSKIEAGRMRFELEDARARSAARRRGAHGRAARRAEAADAHRRDRARRSASRPTGARIKQIVLNLLSNAVKFTPDGGRVTVRGAHGRRHVVDIAIEDTGIGIPKDALKKLGKPFEQVESQFTKTHGGSGLGLAIAKSLAELHGGAMRIRSTLGVGTIVLVRAAASPGIRPRNATCGRDARAMQQQDRDERRKQDALQDPEEQHAHDCDRGGVEVDPADAPHAQRVRQNRTGRRSR